MSSASTATTRGRASIVMVHGAWADGSCWADVIPLLQDKGHAVTAVQNPLSSLADDVAATRRAIVRHAGPTILVGHSWGGVVITEAGNDPSVVGLVYIAAFAPDVGESLSALGGRYPPPPGLQYLQQDAEGWLWFDPAHFAEGFANGIEPAKARVLAAVQGPVTAKAFGASVTTAAWKTKPSWYQVSANDLDIQPDLQRFMAKRIGASTIELRAGHVSMVSHPTEVANLILQAAEKALQQARPKAG